MKQFLLFSLLIITTGLSACNSNTNERSAIAPPLQEKTSDDLLGHVEQAESHYDSNSWKTEIPDDCTSYFDGCNNCSRTSGIAVSACTKKACSQYQKPFCLDVAKDDTPTVPAVRSRTYRCDDDKTFSIHFGEYGEAQKLGADEIVLVGSQEHTLHKVPSDGTEMYQSEQGLQFIDNGLQVILQKDGQVLYSGCKI